MPEDQISVLVSETLAAVGLKVRGNDNCFDILIKHQRIVNPGDMYIFYSYDC